MVRPLQSLTPSVPAGKDGHLPARRVLARLAAWEKLNITADGITISQRGKGNLHFVEKPDKAADHPSWQITPAGTLITVAGGEIIGGSGGLVVQPVTLAQPSTGRIVVQLVYQLILRWTGVGFELLMGEMTSAIITSGGVRSLPSVRPFEYTAVGDFVTYDGVQDYAVLYTTNNGARQRVARGDLIVWAHRVTGALVADAR